MPEDICTAFDSRPPEGEPAFRATLFGRFRFEDMAGRDLLPRSAKTRALVALVLVAPRLTRPRSYLADMLWSDRGRSQALGSLRNAISTLRATLGPLEEHVITDRDSFGFAPGTVASDLATPHPDAHQVFLEDIKVSDPAFLDWLARARAQFGTRAALDARPLVHINTRGSADPIQREMLNHGIANGIGDWCALRVASVGLDPARFSREGPADLADYLLNARLDTARNGTTAHIAFSEQDSALSRWSLSARLSKGGAEIFEETEFFRMINRAADRTLVDLAPPHRDTETSRFLTAGTLGAVRLIFRNAPGDLELASAQLQRNYDIHREGVYLAWLAYVTTLEKAERNAADMGALKDRAQDLCARALERDPFGSMTLALCSYVQSFVLGDAHLGHDLASRAIESNRANPLAWIFRGAANFFEGRGDEALRNTQFGLKISGDGPYGYVVDTFGCAAATCAGRLDDALKLAERASLRAPGYKAPLRYIVAIHAARGDIEALRLAIRRLRRIEPDFTIDSLKERRYPVPGLRAAGLIDPD